MATTAKSTKIRVVYCPRCGRKLDRNECTVNMDHWTLHCRYCGTQVAYYDNDDHKARGGK